MPVPTHVLKGCVVTETNDSGELAYLVDGRHAIKPSLGILYVTKEVFQHEGRQVGIIVRYPGHTRKFVYGVDEPACDSMLKDLLAALAKLRTPPAQADEGDDDTQPT